MTTADAVARRALELAASFLEDSRAEIEAMVGDDGKILYDASQIVRQHAESGPPSVRSVEHLAFSLLTAAHEHIRQRAGVPDDHAPRG